MSETKPNRKILVDTDLTVSIRNIFQETIYTGMAEGYPNEAINNQIIQDMKTKAATLCNIAAVHIIEPEQKPFPFLANQYNGLPVALPEVACIAELFFYGSFKNENNDYSGLAIVWFQDDFAFPIDQVVLEKIKQIPFRRICYEWYF